MRRNIDIAYTLIELCETIENCYCNCGDDFHAFANKQYCDEIALFKKTLNRMDLLFECLTPEFRKQYSSAVITRLWSFIKEINNDNGFSILQYWKRLKSDIITLKGFMLKLVSDYKMLTQPCFADDLHMIEFD